MIRIGRYDAFDKWELLCRYWESKNMLPGLGDDKFGRPRLPRWHDVAMSSGTAACLDYIVVRAQGLAGDPVAGQTATPGAASPIAREIALLSKRIGVGDFRELPGQLAEAIAEAGFAAASCDTCSPELLARLKQVFRLGALNQLQWTEDSGEIPTIAVLRSKKGPFPINAMRRKRKVLCLFCARFYGRVDVIHVHDACPDFVTLVDNDAEATQDMKKIYPGDWDFIISDYQDFLRHVTQDGAQFDLIVADPAPWMAKEVAWDNLPIIMNMCRETLITNYFTDMLDELAVDADDLNRLSFAVSQKAGIEVAFSQMLPRGAGAYWAVIHRR